MAAYNDAQRILDKHLPSRAAGNDILARNLPETERTRAALNGANIRAKPPIGAPGSLATPGPVVPFGGQAARPIPVQPPLSRLGGAIAADAAAVAAQGCVVDINQWAGALEAGGVSGDVIAQAYQLAGGDAVLAPAEQRGDTSAFLGGFVTGLEQQGVSPDLIVRTYQQSMTGCAPSASTADAGTTATASHDTPGSSGHGRGGVPAFLGTAIGGAEHAGQQVLNAGEQAVKAIGKLFGF